MNLQDKKILISYFSHKGNNYVNGSIVDLPVGNTQVVAEMLAEATGGELFEIQAKNEYPFDYHACTEVAQQEKSANARPELIALVENMDAYDIIFLGYPNWWGTCPMPVFTFLDAHDFSGKTILPFCTHEGSGMGASEGEIVKALPTATLRKGLALHGSDVKHSKDQLTSWLEKS